MLSTFSNSKWVFEMMTILRHPDEENEPEDCLICHMPLVPGEKRYMLKDSDGLIWFAHQECIEYQMEKVKK